jgi:hypothetical protein
LISNSHKKIMLISAPIATPMTTDTRRTPRSPAAV